MPHRHAGPGQRPASSRIGGRPNCLHSSKASKRQASRARQQRSSTAPLARPSATHNPAPASARLALCARQQRCASAPSARPRPHQASSQHGERGRRRRGGRQGARGVRQLRRVVRRVGARGPRARGRPRQRGCLGCVGGGAGAPTLGGAPRARVPALYAHGRGRGAGAAVAEWGSRHAGRLGAAQTCRSDLAWTRTAGLAASG